MGKVLSFEYLGVEDEIRLMHVAMYICPDAFYKRCMSYGYIAHTRGGDGNSSVPTAAATMYRER